MDEQRHADRCQDETPGRVAPGSQAHCFVIPAYGQSPFLEECLRSLRRQDVPSPIVLTTSTPFPALRELAQRYSFELIIHEHNFGIGADWNRALDAARSQWVTLAHQDDVYHPSYVRTMLSLVRGVPDVSLALSLGTELRGGISRSLTPLMISKRILTELAFLGRNEIRTRRAKRRLLCFGNPVVCPSVFLNRERLRDFRFSEDFRSNLDWAAWLALANSDGAFLLSRRALVAQRTHTAGETTKLIADQIRREEDLRVFMSVWPPQIARCIAAIYRLSYLNRAGIIQ